MAREWSRLMEIVDAQIHANHRGIDQSIAIMEAVGVNAAVIDIWPPERRKLPNGVMRFEYRFAEEAVARFPGRFGYVARFDPTDPEVDGLMAELRMGPCTAALAPTVSLPRPDRATAAGYRRFRRQAPDVGERFHGSRRSSHLC